MSEGEACGMVKKLSVMLVLAFLAAALAGCGSGGGGGGQKVTLQYWAHMEGPWNAKDEELIKAFEKENPNIKIEYEVFPYDDFESKTQTSLISKSGGADIYKLWGGWAIDFAPTGAFAPVPDAFLADLVNDCYAPVLGAFLHGGKYYGVPLEFNAESGGMLVLKPYFDEHGIGYPTTWDEMIRIATDHAVSNGAVFTMRGLDFISSDTLTYTWLSMILSSGGQYLEGDRFNFDTPIAVQTLQTLADYINVNKITSVDGLAGGGDMESQDFLFAGESLMVPRGIWTIPSGEEDFDLTYGEDFDYVAMPFYGSQKLWAAETGWGLAVNSGSENAEAAWKFVEFCLKPDTLREINIACGMIPPRKSVAHDPAFVAKLPYAKPIIDVLDGASFIGPINTDVLKEAIADAFVDMIQNGTPAATVVAHINEALE